MQAAEGAEHTAGTVVAHLCRHVPGDHTEASALGSPLHIMYRPFLQHQAGCRITQACWSLEHRSTCTAKHGLSLDACRQKCVSG